MVKPVETKLFAVSSTSVESSRTSSFINSVHDLKESNKSANTSEADFYYAIVNGTLTTDKVKIGNVTHLRYENCPKEDLVVLKNGIKIHKDCNDAFSKMQKAANADGVNINIISGFRSVEYQKEVFARKISNKNNPAEIINRAKWSAPSGYSEHSTGYAVDINSITTSFVHTKEYEWLSKNAANYSFELSFPEDNKQGVGCEPWHWRFVGTEDAKEKFKLAQTEYAN